MSLTRIGCALRTRSLWLFALLTISLTGCGNERVDQHQLERIQERGVLHVGTMMSPVNYYLGSDNLETGFEYELAANLAQQLGVELEMSTSYELRDLWSKLESGEIDFVAAGIDVTELRLDWLKFTPAYHNIEQKLVFRQGTRNRPREWSEVNGTIRVVAGSSHEEHLIELSKTYPNLQWTSTHLYDADELLEHVIQEKIDFTIVDSHHLDIKRRAYPNLSVAFTTRNTVPIAWAFHGGHDDSLYAAAVEYIGGQHENGEIAQLVDRYFGHVSEFNFVDTRAFIAATENVLPDYLNLFKEYSGELDWRLLAAVSYQESLWDPWARSVTGVRGLMMLTLPTAQDMGVNSRLDPEQAIRGGAEYLRRLHQRLPDRINEPDRTWMALAAYNVGLGHLEDARIITQRQGGNPDYWIDVRDRLPLLRQKQFYRTTRFGFARGEEPVNYVENIRRYFDTLVWLDDQGRLPASGIDYSSLTQTANRAEEE
ncbi:Putative soluble lytic transglycosylase fused to an ABC-type amino acid-binding protein [Idiomarina sp. A28L]|uniref:membrane-bound lytic murein transglycosylase MltF n=1 Tax=Idiomarina sp. A28L TaxID=1036674 RepID=UPI0002138DF6|nr:membrane-bound lytic murein transglycosylase MltF [Idiomarina sp. A28L]EGN74704.1 Putative soluble lytic transglycosylase fused to an ABC-type amino acid-binding protein [Idiomarina sp. A28L]